MSYFESIIGQARVKNQLERLLKRHTLPHSLLFYGEPGLGKSAMARAVASTLLERPVFKTEPTEYAPIFIEQGDAFWLKAEKLTSGLKIAQWQTLLHEYLTKAATGRRVVIIEDFQTARLDFMNALLKSIEEPPEGVHFILITTQKSGVLPTILSRCMVFPFIPAETGQIVEGLKAAGYHQDVEAAAFLSQGNFQKAIDLLKAGPQKELDDGLTLLSSLTAPVGTFTAGVLLLQEYDKESLRQLLHWLQVLARDMEALRYGAPQDVLFCPQLAGKMRELVPHWPSRALRKLIIETVKGEEALRLNIRPALVVDALLLALRRAIKE